MTDPEIAYRTVVSGDRPRVRPGDSLALMSCVVPSGACEVLADTAGESLRFPVGTVDSTTVTLQDGQS